MKSTYRGSNTERRDLARRAKGLADAERLGYTHGYGGRGWDDSDWFMDGGALESAYSTGWNKGQDGHVRSLETRD